MKTSHMLLVIGDESLQKELDGIIAGKFESLRISNQADGITLALMMRPRAILVDSDSSQVNGTNFYTLIAKQEGVQSVPLFAASKTLQLSDEIKNLSNFKGLLKRPLDPAETLARISGSEGDVLPSPQSVESKSGSPEAPGKKKDNSNIKILSVDDSSVVRKLVSMILTAEGFKVTTASDGLDGINKAKEILPDLVLLDFVMPRMNGFQVCRIFQKDEKLKDIPVILVTSKGDKVGDKFVNQLGVTGFITKPFQPDDLIKKIHQTLENRAVRKSVLTSSGAIAEGASLSEETFEMSSTLESEASASFSRNEGMAGASAMASSNQNLQALIRAEINKQLTGEDFEDRMGKVIEARLPKAFQEKIMKPLEKHIEKIVQDKIKVVQDKVDKIIEYIKKSKQ
jgi:DNA-binding response OmpR family regulator